MDNLSSSLLCNFFVYYFRLIQESQTMMSFKTLFLHQYIPKIILLPLNKMLLYPLLGGIKQNTFSFYRKLGNQFIGIFFIKIFSLCFFFGMALMYFLYDLKNCISFNMVSPIMKKADY